MMVFSGFAPGDSARYGNPVAASRHPVNFRNFRRDFEAGPRRPFE
jgi:hypothetical protein